MSTNHAPLAVFALLNVISSICASPNIERSSDINSDCVPPDVKTCGVLILRTAEGLEKTHNGTEPDLEFRNVTSAEVWGRGCFYLFTEPNYRGEESKVCSGINDKKIQVIKSIEFFLDSNNVERRFNKSRVFFGLTLGFSTLVMFAVLSPELRKSCKRRTEATTEAVELEMVQLQSEGEEEEEEETYEAINYEILWGEILNWRGNLHKQEARKMIILGLIPSALDVSTDYSYGRTWNDQGFNPQIRALVFAFISLPHAVTLLRGLHRVFTFTCLKPRAGNTNLVRGAVAILFLQLVASIVYCAVYLIWYYPDAFAYIGAVSAVITVALKFAGVVVQGPETKKVMVLLNARKVNLVSYANFLL